MTGSKAVLHSHLAFLDALRGIAVLAVLFVHAGLSYIPDNTRLGQFVLIGQRGVQLFYVVSAFTLFYKLDIDPRERRLGDFYLRRFFRIAPLFYIAIIFNLIVNGVANHMRWYHLVSGFLFLNGASIRAIDSVAPGGWSIAVETSFYLLLPFLFARIRTLGAAVALMAISTVVLMPLSFVLAASGNQEYFSFLWFPVEFPVFCIGIVAYMVWKTFIVSSPERTRRRSLSALLLLSSVAILVANLNLQPPANRIPWRNTHMLSSSFLFLPLLLALSLFEWRLLVNPFTRYLGKISYSVYLAHAFILEALDRLSYRVLGHGAQTSGFATAPGIAILHATALYLCTLALSLLVCGVLWEYIEQPGIRLGRRIIAHLEHRVALPT